MAARRTKRQAKKYKVLAKLLAGVSIGVIDAEFDSIMPGGDHGINLAVPMESVVIIIYGSRLPTVASVRKRKRKS